MNYRLLINHATYLFFLGAFFSHASVSAATYDEQIIQLRKALYPLQTQYNRLLPKEKQIYQTVQLGGDVTYDDLVASYKTLIPEFYKAYTAHGFTPRFTAEPNWVTFLVRGIIAIFTKDIFGDLDRLKILFLEKKSTTDPYAVLSVLTQKLQGSKNGKGVVAQTGYVKTIEDIAILAFQDSNEQAAVKKYFYDQLGLLFDVYDQALTSFVQLPDPSDVQLSYTDIFYRQYLDQLRMKLFLNRSTQEASNTHLASIAQSIATLHVRALSRLQQRMNTDQKQQAAAIAKLDNFYQQIAAYYKQAAAFYKNNGDQANYDQMITAGKTYTIYSENLSQARAAQSKAEAFVQAQAISDAIKTYESAEQLYALAQDTADELYCKQKKNTLRVAYEVGVGEKLLETYVSSAQATFDAYLAYISSPEKSTASVTDFTSVHEALITAAHDASPAYQEARSAYAQLDKPFVTVQVALDLLDTTSQALQALVRADKLAPGQDKQEYQRALEKMRTIDRVYQQHTDVAPLVPFYPSARLAHDTQAPKLLAQGQSWSFSLIGARHVARKYLQAADAVVATDPVTAHAYYMYAQEQGSLSEQMSTYVKEQIATVKVTQERLERDAKAVDARLEAVKKASSADWQPDGQQIYTSKAAREWEGLIEAYRNLYALGYKEVAQQYLDALRSYAQGYQQHVPSYFEPLLREGVLYYQGYLFAQKAGDATGAQPFFDAAQKAVRAYVAEVQQLIKSVDLKQVRPTVLDDMQRLSYTHRVLEQVFAEQQSDSTLLTKSAGEHGATIYSFTLSAQEILSVTIPEEGALRADLYAAVAHESFTAKEYGKAFDYFQKARDAYLQIGQKAQADSLTAQSELARVRAQGQWFEQHIVPVGQKKIAELSVTVPALYQVASYHEPIPADVAVAPELRAKFQLLNQWYTAQRNELLPERKQEYQKTIDALIGAIQNDLAQLAGAVYLQRTCTYHGISYSLVRDKKFDKLTQDQQDLVLGLVTKTTEFVKFFTDRIAQKQTPFNFVITPQGNYLVINKMPMPGLDIVLAGRKTPLFDKLEQLDYKYYPTTFLYAFLSWLFYQPRPNFATWSYGKVAYVPGDDQESANRVLTTIAEAFLSRAAAYQQAIDSMMNRSATKVEGFPADELQRIADARAELVQATSTTHKITDSLNDYMSSYRLLKQYIDEGATILWDAARYYYDQAQVKTYDAALTKMSGALYVSCADLVRTKLLFGNPNDAASNFLTLANDAKDCYITALTTYNAIDPLTAFINIIDLYKKGGDLLVQAANYRAAGDLTPSSWYVKARIWANTYIQRYDKDKKNPVMRQKMSELLQAQLNAQYLYAIQKMGEYAQDRTSVDGSGKSIKAVVDAYLKDTTTDEKAYRSAREKILDSIIYYNGVSFGVSGALQILDLTSTSSAVIQKEATTLLTNYLKTQNITIEEPSAQEPKKFISFISAPDSSIKLKRMFDDLRAQAETLTAYTKPVQIAIGYKAIGLWVVKLITQLEKLISFDFRETIIQVQYDIKAELQQDQTNASQYLGGTGS